MSQNATCGVCGNAYWKAQMVEQATRWVCQGCIAIGDMAQVQAAQAQQLEQHGMGQHVNQLLVTPTVRCCLCDGNLQHIENDGIVRCNQCRAPHTVFADAHPPRLPRDRDGMLLADRLQVLADENVVLLAENARLRRRVEDLERKR